jgi:hypothetical protein
MIHTIKQHRALLIVVVVVALLHFRSDLMYPQQAQPLLADQASSTSVKIPPPSGSPSNESSVSAQPSGIPSSSPSKTHCESEPKIYVYPAPSGMDVGKKGSRIYFELETELLAGLQQRGRVVDDPTKANLFWVPQALVEYLLGSEATAKNYYDGHLRPFLQQIYYDTPYFNASNGRDHVFVNSLDLGPICPEGSSHGDVYAHDDLWHRVVHPMIQIGYWGQRGLVPAEKASSVHRPTCWVDERDIAVPQYHRFEMRNSVEAANCLSANNSCEPWVNLLRKRAASISATFFFRGNVRTRGHFCSIGIRGWVEEFCRNTQWCEGAKQMTDAVFGLCPAGWACWSSRLYDAFDKGTIPVLLADDMVIPFERWLDYDKLQIQIATGNPVNLSRNRGDEFSELHDLAQSWLQVCNNATASDQACISHRVSQLMGNIAMTRKWFGWHTEGDENAFAIVEKELMARVNPAICGTMD